tara:strand:+ start:76 stop:537 length:462 start_codon:yes stop_codon:yes gene_type:complete
MNKGSKHGKSILTEEDVYIIKEKLAKGENHREIAKTYGVAKSTITSINQGLSWKHIIIKTEFTYDDVTHAIAYGHGAAKEGLSHYQTLINYKNANNIKYIKKPIKLVEYSRDDVIKLFNTLTYEMGQKIIGNRKREYPYDHNIIPSKWIKNKI